MSALSFLGLGLSPPTPDWGLMIHAGLSAIHSEPWLILIPAGPGALVGGYIGEHLGLRYALGLAGVGALALSWQAWRRPVIRNTRRLPSHRSAA